jgi:phage terminase large subunit GpA-like protein
MPVCPSCEERIELDIRRDLKFDRGTPEEAEASAHVVCPASGCILEPSARRKLLDSCKTLPNRGWVALRPEAGKRRRTFRRDGLLAFTSWGKLAREWRDAQVAWEARQDESALRTFFNVKGGQNYRSVLSGEKPIASEELAQRREPGFELGAVPAGVKVLTVTVDVQHDRFELGCVGWGEGLESWLIDRWALHALDDGLTGLRPFNHPEHWAVLLPLFSRTWPLADGSGVSPPALSVAVDTGGHDQAAEGAKRFFEMARAMGVHPSRITLIKGGNNPNGKLMPPAQFADQKLKGGPKRNSARLWMPNVHALKNILDARLRREKPGPGYVHLPGELELEHVEEITAEQLEKGKWKKIRARNETLDILIYAIASLLRPPFAGSRSDMKWVPKDFRVPDQAQSELPVEDAKPRLKRKAEPKPSADPSAREEKAEPRPRRSPARRGARPMPGWMRRLQH